MLPSHLQGQKWRLGGRHCGLLRSAGAVLYTAGPRLASNFSDPSTPNSYLLGLLLHTSVVRMVETIPKPGVRLCCFQKVAVLL